MAVCCCFRQTKSQVRLALRRSKLLPCEHLSAKSLGFGFGYGDFCQNGDLHLSVAVQKCRLVFISGSESLIHCQMEDLSVGTMNTHV